MINSLIPDAEIKSIDQNAIAKLALHKQYVHITEMKHHIPFGEGYTWLDALDVSLQWFADVAQHLRDAPRKMNAQEVMKYMQTRPALQSDADAWDGLI